MAVRQEPLVRLPELPVRPESPAPDRTAGDQQGPRSTRARDNSVPVQSRAEPRTRSLQELRPVTRVLARSRGLVSIAALEHDRPEPPGMIMEGAVVVGSQPVVQADGPEGELHPPPDHVRALRKAELLPEPDEYRGMDSDHRPPLTPSGALTRGQRPRGLFLSYPGMATETSASCRFPSRHGQSNAGSGGVIPRCPGQVTDGGTSLALPGI